MEILNAQVVLQIPEGCLDTPAEMVELFHVGKRELVFGERGQESLPITWFDLKPDNPETDNAFRLEEPSDLLARRSGLTRQYVGLVEKHQKTPSVKVLVALCDALDLDVYINPK